MTEPTRPALMDGRVGSARALKLLIVSAALVIIVASEARSEGSDRCVQTPVAQGSHGPGFDQQDNKMLTVVSLNMAGEERVSEILAAWKQTNSLDRADILLLQEVRQSSGDSEAMTAALGRQLGLSFAYAAADRLTNGSTQGLAILSRYPLKHVRVLRLKYFRLRFRSRCRIALVATVDTPAGSVRVVNVHLDTRINSGNRLTQLTPVLEEANGFDGPQLIGGDFNTMNILWFRTMWPFPYLQRQSTAVRETLVSRGFRTPLTATSSTFKFLGLPFKLDWLYVRNLKPFDWGVDRIRFSDHHAVWVQLDLTSIRN